MRLTTLNIVVLPGAVRTDERADLLALDREAQAVERDQTRRSAR